MPFLDLLAILVDKCCSESTARVSRTGNQMTTCLGNASIGPAIHFHL